MARPSSIDRLPDQVREQIGALRRQGSTIDEIMAKLGELLAGAETPSRSALGRHVKRIDVLGDRIRASREMANALVDRLGDDGENKMLRLNAELLQSALMDLLVSEDGEPVTLEAKDAAFLATALQRIAGATKTDADLTLKIREEAERKAKVAAVKAAETVGRERGLSSDTIQAIRAQILGVKA